MDSPPKPRALDRVCGCAGIVFTLVALCVLASSLSQPWNVLYATVEKDGSVYSDVVALEFYMSKVAEWPSPPTEDQTTTTYSWDEFDNDICDLNDDDPMELACDPLDAAQFMFMLAHPFLIGAVCVHALVFVLGLVVYATPCVKAPRSRKNFSWCVVITAKFPAVVTLVMLCGTWSTGDSALAIIGDTAQTASDGEITDNTTAGVSAGHARAIAALVMAAASIFCQISPLVLCTGRPVRNARMAALAPQVSEVQWAPVGQQAAGNSSYKAPPFAQQKGGAAAPPPPYNPQAYAPPAAGEQPPPYNQAAYGQPQYAQPQYAQPQYGQPQYA